MFVLNKIQRKKLFRWESQKKKRKRRIWSSLKFFLAAWAPHTRKTTGGRTQYRQMRPSLDLIDLLRHICQPFWITISPILSLHVSSNYFVIQLNKCSTSKFHFLPKKKGFWVNGKQLENSLRRVKRITCYGR